MENRIIECVPNFSEGRDMNIIRAIRAEIERAHIAAHLASRDVHHHGRRIVHAAPRAAPQDLPNIRAEIGIGAKTARIATVGKAHRRLARQKAPFARLAPYALFPRRARCGRRGSCDETLDLW